MSTAKVRATLHRFPTKYNKCFELLINEIYPIRELNCLAVVCVKVWPPLNLTLSVLKVLVKERGSWRKKHEILYEGIQYQIFYAIPA